MESSLSVEEKFKLVRSVGEECVTESELTNLLTRKPNFNLYDGFEPSGRMHIAQGVFKAMNVNKCTKAGGTFIFWVADWFALMNDKMGGDLEKIRTVGKYLIEVWKAAGMDMSHVKFLWSSDEIVKNAESYWTTALDITRHFTIARIIKCCTIMGRGEEGLTAAQILYPIMQCTDIFFLKADICQLGVDQRKVNMLAREYCDASGRKFKPIILSHHMLYGLKKGQAKMSKSDPESAVFMEDTAEDVERKINNAYCPTKPEPKEEKPGEEKIQLKDDPLANPCLDYVEHIIFCAPDAVFTVGETQYKDFGSVKEDLLAEKISETQLKKALTDALNKCIEPVRQHFAQGEPKELLALIKSYSKEATASPLKRIEASEFTKPYVIFSPLAQANWKLDTLFTLVQLVRSIPQGAEGIFWVRDWSSFVENSCGGEMKVIQSSFTFLIETLKAVLPEQMNKIKIIFQSVAILKDPSNYWISVINVGRKLKLHQVQAITKENLYVGSIISSLMHIGDVLATNPTHIITTAKDEAHHKLALEYYKAAEITTLHMSEIVVVDAVDGQLRQRAEGSDDPDLDLFLLDSTADVSRKTKKAFCEPQNVQYCPPLVISKTLIELEIPICVTRKAENGGDKTFSVFEELHKDFESGALHPGDLKPGVTKAIEIFMQKFRPVMTQDPSKKAIVDLKNSLKKANQKKNQNK